MISDTRFYTGLVFWMGGAIGSVVACMLGLDPGMCVCLLTGGIIVGAAIWSPL